MSVARVTELSATSETGFEDAINQAVARATKTLRGVEGAWVKDMNVMIENGNITGYKVNVEVTSWLEVVAALRQGRAPWGCHRPLFLDRNIVTFVVWWGCAKVLGRLGGSPHLIQEVGSIPAHRAH